jgi:hypothetical protein
MIYTSEDSASSKGKDKVTPLQAQLWPRGGRSIALLLQDLGARRGEWSGVRPRRTFPPGKTRYPLYRRLGGPQGRSGRAENLAPTGIRSPDRPVRSQSLYRLSYRAHILLVVLNVK